MGLQTESDTSKDKSVLDFNRQILDHKYVHDNQIAMFSNKNKLFERKNSYGDKTADQCIYEVYYKSKSYHTVFNGEVSKDELQGILAWLCLFTKDW